MFTSRVLHKKRVLAQFLIILSSSNNYQSKLPGFGFLLRSLSCVECNRYGVTAEPNFICVNEALVRVRRLPSFWMNLRMFYLDVFRAKRESSLGEQGVCLFAILSIYLLIQVP
jgi:hypothetical protein